MFDEVDIHITYIILIILVLAIAIDDRLPEAFVYFPTAIALLIPQGRIYVRAFWDYPKFGRKKMPYIIANEIQVIVAVLICFSIITINN